MCICRLWYKGQLSVPVRAVPEVILRGRGGNVFLSVGWMHNNVKFVMKDEDIQVNTIQSWYSDLSWGWAFVPFCMSWGRRSKKNCRPPP